MEGPKTALKRLPSAGTSLADLLRRCHKDELLPLCKTLDVNPQGLGFGTVCANLERRLCQVGGNELGNIVLRKGHGPPYAAVVEGLLKRLKVDAGASLEENELRILDHWLAEAWDELDGADRGVIWQALGLQGEAPAVGAEATKAAQEELKEGFGYRAGLLAAGGVARIAGLALTPLYGPFAGIAMALWLVRPKDDILLPAVLEVCRLRQTVRHRVTVGVVGSPSAGKDACIRAIFGIDSGNIDPIAGSTREVTITRLPSRTALYLVNTPGMGDVVEQVTEEARQILDHIDIFIYVLNAQGGVQAREKKDFAAVTARGRPVLVALNKIDTLKVDQRQRYVDDAVTRLGVPPDDLFGVAFDPLPQLTPMPIGLAEVQAWLLRHLVALGKDPAELPWTQAAASAPSAETL